VTLWNEWDKDEYMASDTVRVRSMRLEVEEELEAQAEVFQRFSRDVLGNSSDNPKASNSEDEDASIPPDVDSDSAVQVVTGDDFVITPEYDGPQWANPISLAYVLRD
jgi:hypothetical protein